MSNSYGHRCARWRIAEHRCSLSAVNIIQVRKASEVAVYLSGQERMKLEVDDDSVFQSKIENMGVQGCVR